VFLIDQCTKMSVIENKHDLVSTVDAKQASFSVNREQYLELMLELYRDFENESSTCQQPPVNPNVVYSAQNQASWPLVSCRACSSSLSL